MESKQKLSDLIEYIGGEMEKNKNEFKRILKQDINNYVFMKEDTKDASKKELPNETQILVLKNEILNLLSDSAQNIIYIYEPTEFTDETCGIDLLDQDLRLALAYSYMLKLLMGNKYNDFVKDINERVICVLSKEIGELEGYLKKFCSAVHDQENEDMISTYSESMCTKKMSGLINALNNPIETIEKRRYKLSDYEEIIATKGISKTIVNSLFNKISKVQKPKEYKSGQDKFNFGHSFI